MFVEVPHLGGIVGGLHLKHLPGRYLGLGIANLCASAAFANIGDAQRFPTLVFTSNTAVTGVRYSTCPQSMAARTASMRCAEAERLAIERSMAAKILLFIIVIVYFIVMVRALVRAIYAGL